MAMAMGFGGGFFHPGLFKSSIKIKTIGLGERHIVSFLCEAGARLDSMLDRAKVQLSCCNHRRHKSHNAHTIGAIGAVRFGNPVEVFQLLAIKDDEVFARERGDAVNGKTSPLVKRHKGVEDQQGDDHAVDDGAGDQIDRS